MERFKWFKRISQLNARVDLYCGRKDGRTENRTPISHLAKVGATKTYVLKTKRQTTKYKLV